MKNIKTDLCERVKQLEQGARLREIDCANLEADRNDLRERVKELEKLNRYNVAQAKADAEALTRERDEARAKLARVVALCDDERSRGRTHADLAEKVLRLLDGEGER